MMWFQKKHEIGDPITPGYVPYRASHAYLARESAIETRNKRMLVGREGCWGARWHYGPLWFEGYVGDVEPVIEPCEHPRLVVWQTVERLDTPAGWRRAWVRCNPRMTGYAPIVNPEAYWETWTNHAQRHRKRWLKQTEFEVSTASLEEFIEAYHATRKLLTLRGLFVWLTKKKIAAHGDNVRLIVIREKASGLIAAGFVALDIPEDHQSIHLVSFLHPAVERHPASVGTGIIDEWFKQSIARGIRFMDFDLFYAPGDPKDWKGFSQFKSQFGTRFIKYPYALLKWVGNG
jgi:hypothetical protein